MMPTCTPTACRPRSSHGFIAVVSLAACASAAAQTSPVQLAPVNVTSTQIERPVFDTPASVDLIDGAAMRANRIQVNLSESLAGVPGLLIQDRQNFAQDLRIA